MAWESIYESGWDKLIHQITSVFLNQQFITRSARADRGRHNVSTYMETEPTCEQKRREKEKKKKKRKEKKRVLEKGRKI